MKFALWAIWSAFTITWTVGLLMPVPQPEFLPLGELIQQQQYLFAKTLHVGVNATWTFFTAFLPVAQKWRVWLIAFLFAHGTATEMLQFALQEYTNRFGNLFDVGFDHLGVLIGLALGCYWWTKSDH